MTKVAFTGTRGGMTEAQVSVFSALLGMLEIGDIFRHGDCVGSDSQAHTIAQKFGLRIFIHPPKEDRARAFCSGAAQTFEPKEYLDRNHDMVDGSDILIACPRGNREELRSGTWATIRYARKQKVRLIIINHQGRVHWENFVDYYQLKGNA